MDALFLEILLRFWCALVVLSIVLAALILAALVATCGYGVMGSLCQ